MVLNIKELNLDKDKKYVVFLDSVDKTEKTEAIKDMQIIEDEFKRIGIDNNNIFYFPFPIIIWGEII